jgi:hypothetical protein
MRCFAVFLVTLLFVSTITASAAADTSPVGCAWDKLPAAEQTRLRKEFKVELRDGGFTILFANPDAAAADNAAQQCQLNSTPLQIENLALGLARHAAVENAKQGIADKGENPASLEKALAQMHEGKRETIGNRLACPGPHDMIGEWDQSLKRAIGKAKLGFKDARAYSWVSLGLYAMMAEEGAVRRMAGQADACSG